jgi:hypothetical protein
VTERIRRTETNASTDETASAPTKKPALKGNMSVDLDHRGPNRSQNGFVTQRTSGAQRPRVTANHAKSARSQSEKMTHVPMSASLGLVAQTESASATLTARTAMGDEAAIVRHRWQGAGSFEGTSFTDDNRCVLVWEQQAGKWRIVLDQCSFSSK